MEETSGWHCMGSKGSQITTMWLLAGAFQAWSVTTNPHGETTGYLLLCANSSYFFLPAEKLDTVLPLCGILFTPQRTKGQPKHRVCVVPTGASWRHCSEESLAHPGHKHVLFMELASCRTWLFPLFLSASIVATVRTKARRKCSWI